MDILYRINYILMRLQHQMANERCVTSLTMHDHTVDVTEFKPMLKWIGYRTPENSGAYEASSDDMVEDELERLVLTKEDTSEDEIEDW